MSITLTENAARHIRSQLDRRGTGLGIRIGVKKVGCSGYAYTYEFADDVRPGDQLIAAHDAAVVVDADALALLDGARIDFVKDGMKQSFAIDNPNVANACGCGESFSLKETVS